MKEKLIALLVLALSLVLATTTIAQKDTADYQFTDVIDVQLVNVEVWVTDKQDRPINGLTIDDFEILEDGQPVEITYFAEVRQDKPVVSSLERVLAEPTADAEPVPAPAPIVDPSHLVIYFDELHLTPASRKQAIKDIRAFLAEENVEPERVLILTQHRDLKTEVTFGSSWRELDEALARIEQSLPRGGAVASEKRLAIRSLQDLWQWSLETAGQTTRTSDPIEAACEVFLPRAVADVEAYAAVSRERITITLDHLSSAASFLTGIPGVKTLIFVSDALERAPGADLVTLINDFCPVQTTTPMFLLSDELSADFRTLTRHANANRVTIYALQTEGLSSGFTTGAEQAAGGLPRASTAFDTAKRLSEREGMIDLAVETGGRAIFNRNEFDAELEAISNEMSSYYSLAYEPPHGGDRNEHEISVRMKGKGLKARHRRGYRDKDQDSRMTERLQAAIYLGLVDNPLGVRLGAGTVSAKDADLLTLPLHILVPADRIVFLPSDQGVSAQLSIQVSTRNTADQKGVFDHRAYRINWQTDSDQEVVALSMDLEVPPGVHLVAVGVRDDTTHAMSFVSTTLEIHASASNGATGP
jgi:VWFA-related protein